jgi:hypothetical protein
MSCRPRSSRGYLEMASGCQCDFERWVTVGEVAPPGHGLNIAEEGHERCRLISAQVVQQAHKLDIDPDVLAGRRQDWRLTRLDGTAEDTHPP